MRSAAILIGNGISFLLLEAPKGQKYALLDVPIFFPKRKDLFTRLLFAKTKGRRIRHSRKPRRARSVSLETGKCALTELRDPDYCIP